MITCDATSQTGLEIDSLSQYLLLLFKGGKLLRPAVSSLDLQCENQSLPEMITCSDPS